MDEAELSEPGFKHAVIHSCSQCGRRPLPIPNPRMKTRRPLDLSIFQSFKRENSLTVLQMTGASTADGETRKFALLTDVPKVLHRKCNNGLQGPFGPIIPFPVLNFLQLLGIFGRKSRLLFRVKN